MDIQNPWLHLPTSPPFVLEADKNAVLRFNQKARPEHAIRLELLPEPFIGRPSAPIVLLGLNPGFDPEDETHHRDPTFYSLSRKNLAHELEDHPFYLLHPSLRAPGTCWCERRLSGFLARVPPACVANAVLCVEYFPYHWLKFGARLSVPSHQYSFSLVRRALGRQALVIVLRSIRLWEAAIPELARYPHKYVLRSAQNATVSERNCPGGYPGRHRDLGAGSSLMNFGGGLPARS